MKKITFSLVIFCIAAFLFCCKTYKGNIVPDQESTVNNELSDYLNSAKGVMHNAPVPQAQTDQPVVIPGMKPTSPLDLHTYKIPVIPDQPVSQGDEPVLTKKQERKAIRAMIKKKVDDEEIGMAIGLIILYLVLGTLIIIGLVYLIAYSFNNSGNNNTGGGSNSSTGSGSGGSGSGSGCYVATMVYGSYDAPEVLVLRRFRDEKLAHSKAGRAFIRWYYGWSPGFVKKYHHLSWLHAIIKVALNRMVKFLS